MKKDQITKNMLVKILDQYLFGWAYKDIERASIYGEAKLAGFILGACFIDALAGFRAGVTKQNIGQGSSKRFKDFSKQYLPKYNSDKLYVDLRCGLVHSYAEGGTYVFTDANKAGFHFNKCMNNKIILNLEDFLSDLREAYRNYRNDILTNPEIFDKARARYESMYLMGLVTIQNNE